MDKYQTLLAISELNGAYAETLDSNDLESWPRLFSDDCLYVVTSRDNRRAGRDMGVIYCNTKGMLNDRVLALRTANVFEGQHYRHILSVPTRVRSQADGSVRADTSFAVFRIMRDGRTSLFMTGIYEDVLLPTDDGFLIKERIAVCDSSLFDTLLAIPL